MDGPYVAALPSPLDIDKDLIRENVRDLIVDRSFKKDTIRYAINNILKSVESYEDDYNPNTTYYRVSFRDKDRNVVIFKENLAHLLGLPNSRALEECAIIYDLLDQENIEISSRNMLKVFTSLLKKYSQEIIDFDSDNNNAEEPKLNWDKIAYKVFAFLNMGVLSDDKTTYFEKLKVGRFNSGFSNSPDYIFDRPCYSDPSQTIRIQFDEGKDKYGNIVLTPRSIRIIPTEVATGGRRVEGFSRPLTLGVELKKEDYFANYRKN